MAISFLQLPESYNSAQLSERRDQDRNQLSRKNVQDIEKITGNFFATGQFHNFSSQLAN